MSNEILENKNQELPLSVKKKVLFSIVTVVIIYIFTELLSGGVYLLQYGKFSFSSQQGKREKILTASKGSNLNKVARGRNWNVLHPFLGFVTESNDPNRKCDDTVWCDRRARTYDDFPFVESTDDNLIVGVLGGSFAHGITATADILEHELKKVPEFKGKKIIIYKMAAGGYKQPQQLMKLNYYLSLGAQFDIIINIDGFNEIALPGVENLSKGVHPIFPRSWYYYVDGSLNPELLALYGAKEYARKQQFQRAFFFSRPFLRQSITANLLWELSNTHLLGKIQQANVDLVEYKEDSSRKRRYAVTGPDYLYSSKENFYQDLAKIWARCSLMMFNQCRTLGIKYYHFLQPNQYVPNSKPMSAGEQRIAVSSRSRYGSAAREGYPYLIKQGDWLKTKNVPYYDLTMIFSDNPKDLYIDDCCHLNMPGYSLVIRDIVEKIKESL